MVRAAAAAVEDEKSGEAAGRETTLHRDQIDPLWKARERRGASSVHAVADDVLFASRRVPVIIILVVVIVAAAAVAPSRSDVALARAFPTHVRGGI